MAEAVTASYDLKLTAVHRVALGLSDASDPTTSHDIGSHRATLNGSSTIPVSKAWSDSGNLSGGTATLDLTALTMSNLPDVDLTGLKVKLIKIECPSTNSAGVVVDIGAANPYDVFGDANGQITVLPGQVYLAYLAEEAEDVDATHCELDLSSGDADAAYSILLVAGDT